MICADALIQVKVTDWVAGNYYAGKADKPTNGELKLRPFEGLLGMLS